MSALALPPSSTVRAELRALVAAARGALAWHREGGELELPVPDDFALPPLGLIEPAPRKTPISKVNAEARAATSPLHRPPVMEDSTGPDALAPPASGSVGQASPSVAPVALRHADPAPRPQNARGVAALALDATEVELGACTRCGLCRNRKELVFGGGAADARLMFVGDVPGPAEDALGAPFADEAGALLGKMVRAMGLSRRAVYLNYLLKCHPGGANTGGTATPGPESWAACKPFFDRQLDAIRPQVIVALGENAARTLCASEASMPRLRGRWGSYRGIDVLPTFHPAALVQNPNDRNLRAWVWDDLKKVMRHLGLAPPEG